MREREEWEEGAAKERRRKEEAAKTSFKANDVRRMNNGVSSAMADEE
ncbi:hypothetical protein T4B_9058 [Trichinella pseudospiralis]|uniref:Uncharacterized protein n=1 Tax=Trichinella pseudospiralis TaxID=6337 RepID=A0A0V1GYQ4_TRIPS|nr:hypothetical protein T4B_4930 [Trichinella pseudospiralis]KRZ02910.1 hypothetical protein T4B_11811 [Trichinella pseudospiralis]KRZ03114.1 hypothetical protein T4B_1687 [Trichinella pseudospiralis]KRZ03315.1 hypothetical protein T4B_9058 [Trichinella pseudospiralis]